MKCPAASIIYGRFSKTKKQTYSWGKKGVLFSNWDKLKLSGSIIECRSDVPYRDWADRSAENLCIVEEGGGSLLWNGQELPIGRGHAFKVLPGNEPIIHPRGKLLILSVQLPHKGKISGIGVEVMHPKDIPSKVYEFETLAKEIFTPSHKPGLGLIQFVFPIDAIPLHRHPNSGRLIRPISGRGYTYAEPNVYEMKNDSFTLFPNGVIHTNGPVPGNVLKLWAFQLPWVPSEIDEEHIAGSPRFVKYVGPTPPRKLWKKKADFERVMKRFSGTKSF